MMKTLWWKRLELALSSAFTECWTGAKWMPAIPNIHYIQLLHTNPWISIKTYLFLLHYMFATFLTLSLKWLIWGFATFKKYPWSYFIFDWFLCEFIYLKNITMTIECCAYQWPYICYSHISPQRQIQPRQSL